MAKKGRRTQFEVAMRVNDYTFVGLAEELGVSDKTLRSFRDGGNISLDTLIAISKKLKVSVDQLLGLNPSNNQYEILRENFKISLRLNKTLIKNYRTYAESFSKLAEHVLGTDAQTGIRSTMNFIHDAEDLVKQLERLI